MLECFGSREDICGRGSPPDPYSAKRIFFPRFGQAKFYVWRCPLLAKVCEDLHSFVTYKEESAMGIANPLLIKAKDPFYKYGRGWAYGGP